MQQLWCDIQQHQILGLDLHWVQLQAQAPLPPYRGGQYLNLLLDNGEQRPFSIANAPDGQRLELHIREVPGNAWNQQALAHLASHRQVQVQLPLGQCVVREGDRPLLMLAGGTGLAPLKAMVEELIQTRDPRPVHFFRAAQVPEHLYLPRLHQGWKHPALRYYPVVQQPSPDWNGLVGNGVEAVLNGFASLAEFDIYLAGRDAMVLAALEAFLERGARRDRIFSDTLDLLAATQ